MTRWNLYQRRVRLVKTGQQLEVLLFGTHPLFRQHLQAICAQLASVDKIEVYALDTTQSMQLEQFQHICHTGRSKASQALRVVSESIIRLHSARFVEWPSYRCRESPHCAVRLGDTHQAS